MIVNISKEKISERRSPTTSNYEKGATMQFTHVELKDPIQLDRENLQIVQIIIIKDLYQNNIMMMI